MATIAAKLQEVNRRLAAACQTAARPVHSVTLMAVSKTFGALEIREAEAAGQRIFGENYVQEALAKMDELTDLDGRIEWHFIGPLQSNKARAVAERFAWCHSVDRIDLARRLSKHRPAHLAPLRVCLQVNISGEESKSGLAPGEVARVAADVATLPGLRLRGLMAVPRPAASLAEQRTPFAELRELMRRIDLPGTPLDTLSMGMSDDLEAAILEGATMVRVGSAIFGARPRPA